MVKKPFGGLPRRRAARAVDDEDIRSARLVLRVHPDLLERLDYESEYAGMSRSIFVEMIIVAFLNRDGRVLDHRGRKSTVEPTDKPLRSPEDFSAAWAKTKKDK